ncbi:MAG TPA: cutinase, partial [Mycobacterium sp.]|nr:cutinase [Mycobacterium sp.]
MARKTSTQNRRRRHRILGLIAAGAMAVVVALVVAIIVVVMRKPASPPSAVPPTAVPPTSVPGGKKPRPEFQDASCPDVNLIAIPGTWESSPTDDPLNPTQFPIALLRNVTGPLRDQFGT